MYRKHLKMARGKGEQEIRSHFVERVANLPMVHVAWDYATITYSNLKEYSRIANFTLTNAERSVTFVAGQAKPMVLKFEKQIQAVDDLACKGLGTLEEKVPFITKPADELKKLSSEIARSHGTGAPPRADAGPYGADLRFAVGPEQIITDTTTTVYSRLEGIKNYGTDRVKSVTDYALDKATVILGKTVVDSLLNSVDGALVITENYLDRFLPPTEDEKKKKTEEDESAISRLVDIPSKILHRSYRTLVLRIEYAQERSLDILLYPIGLIETSKVHVENTLRYLYQLWESLKKEHTLKKEDGETSRLEHQLVHLGRMVSQHTAAAHSTSFSSSSSDDCEFDEDLVHDDLGCFECPKYSEGSSSPGHRHYESYSSAPAYVHLWISVMA